MRDKLLIADSDEEVRKEIAKAFRGEYHIIHANNGKDAIFEITSKFEEIALVIMALEMPLYTGAQVMAVMNIKKLFGKFPVIIMSDVNDEEVRDSMYEAGATAMLIKPLDELKLRHRVKEFTRVYQNVTAMEDQLKKQEAEIKKQKLALDSFNGKLVDAISEIVEFRNFESSKHIKRVRGFTEILTRQYAKMYPEEELTEHSIDIIVRAAALHDIGKISIPDNILVKPGRLTDDERMIMMSHTTRGCDVLKKLVGVQDQEYYRVAYEVVRSHHERDDGKGYPDGLKGEDIPLAARIVSLCDVYDALVSERVYKKAYSNLQAFDMIMNGECGAFHEKIIQAFWEAREAIEAFSDENQ